MTALLEKSGKPRVSAQHFLFMAGMASALLLTSACATATADDDQTDVGMIEQNSMVEVIAAEDGNVKRTARIVKLANGDFTPIEVDEDGSHNSIIFAGPAADAVQWVDCDANAESTADIEWQSEDGEVFVLGTGESANIELNGDDDPHKNVAIKHIIKCEDASTVGTLGDGNMEFHGDDGPHKVIVFQKTSGDATHMVHCGSASSTEDNVKFEWKDESEDGTYVDVSVICLTGEDAKLENQVQALEEAIARLEADHARNQAHRARAIEAMRNEVAKLKAGAE